MNVNELKSEVEFGLENLEKIHLIISKFAGQDIDAQVKASALAYECLGYYNAIEHLIIRILKHLKIEIPVGPFSHRDTLKTFNVLMNERKIDVDDGILKAIEDLMAFRHMATKIYGFSHKLE